MLNGRRMRFLSLLAPVLLLALPACSARRAAPAPAPASAPAPAGHHGGAIHWSYGGDHGPQHWGELSPGFTTCATGRAQSPIDLAGAAPADLPEIAFDYRLGPMRVVDTGHSIQADLGPGSSIGLEGVVYPLRQFHFHAPSEHAVDGRLAAAELHIVHQADTGGLAVVGVMIEAGAENRELAPMWDELLPATGGGSPAAGSAIDPARLLPPSRSYVTYLGSLTTPPCSEPVRWLVLTTPIEMSPEQIGVLAALVGPNNRPLQPRNGRALSRSAAGPGS